MRVPLPNWSVVAASLLSIAALGWIDWNTGYELNFFVFYFAPVAWAAWSLGAGWAVFLSLISALTWMGAESFSGHLYSSHLYLVWNTSIRMISFLSIGAAVARVRRLLEVERAATDALQRALSEIKVLEAFLPICAECKKIRDESGQWQRIETYIGQRTNTQFSHGYCPDCLRRALAEADIAGPVPPGGGGR